MSSSQASKRSSSLKTSEQINNSSILKSKLKVSSPTNDNLAPKEKIKLPMTPLVSVSTPVSSKSIQTESASILLEEPIVSQTSFKDELKMFVKQVETGIKNLQKKYGDEKGKKRRSVSSLVPRVSSLTKPVDVSVVLCKFFGVEEGTKMARTEVSKKLNMYIKEHSLQAGKLIKPDEKLKTVLGDPIYLVDKHDESKGYGYTYFNLQKYLKVHYITSSQ